MYNPNRGMAGQGAAGWGGMGWGGVVWDPSKEFDMLCSCRCLSFPIEVPTQSMGAFGLCGHPWMLLVPRDSTGTHGIREYNWIPWAVSHGFHGYRWNPFFVFVSLFVVFVFFSLFCVLLCVFCLCFVLCCVFAFATHMYTPTKHNPLGDVYNPSKNNPLGDKVYRTI